jgi:flagellar M-ring protein FliF
VTSNTPPPAATASPRPPQGTAPNASASPVNGETSATRTYELGRQVAVSNIAPGSLKRLSVAVAISAKALRNTNTDLDQIKQLVSAAVGASQQRGDQVAVVAREFRPPDMGALPFYEAPWFISVLRNVMALLAVLLVLLLGVRPLVKALKRDKAGDAEAQELAGAVAGGTAGAIAGPTVAFAASAPIDPAVLSEQVGLAQRLVSEKQDAAVAALRQMLGEEQSEASA